MAQADTQAYYRQMLPQISAGATAGVVVPGARTSVAQCRADLGGSDDNYVMRCPAPWLQIHAPPTQASGQLVFAKAYFNWAKGYVAAALRAKPATTASAEVRVVWALDVWAHVQYALWALNLCWTDWPSSVLPLSGGRFSNPHGTPSFGMVKVADALAADLKAFYDSADAERVRAARTGPGQFVGQGETWDVSDTLAPAPFMTHTVFWVLAAPRINNKRPNNLWSLLLQAIQPWSTTWGSNWVTSKNGKDTGELRGYANDPVMLRALMQWRLWSVRDHFSYWSSRNLNPNFWPLNMGVGDDCTTLSKYISRVAGETPEAIHFATYAYPTFRMVFDQGIQRIGYALARLNFDEVVTEQAMTWSVSATPLINPDGTPMTIDQRRVAQGLAPEVDARLGGRLAQQPITYVDYRDLLKGLREAITLRARAAIQNPEMLCDPQDSACREAARQRAEVQTTAQEVPVFGDLMNAMSGVADWLVTQVGAAVGNIYIPFKVLRNPFARTLTSQGYDMAANGSTASVFSRVSIAMLNAGRLSNIGAPAPVSAPRRPRPQFVDDRCIANCPPAPGADAQKSCSDEWQALLQKHRERGVPGLDCLSRDATRVYIELCTRRASGEISDLQAMGQWLSYVQEQCVQRGGQDFEMPSAVPPTPTLWQGFISGALRASTFGHWVPELFIRR